MFSIQFNSILKYFQFADNSRDEEIEKYRTDWVIAMMMITFLNYELEKKSYHVDASFGEFCLNFFMKCKRQRGGHPCESYGEPTGDKYIELEP